jgi:hypothetical protein
MYKIKSILFQTTVSDVLFLPDIYDGIVKCNSVVDTDSLHILT